MSRSISIFESAHKGDFDLVRNKLEEDPTLLNKQDEVFIETTIEFFQTFYCRIREFFCIGLVLAEMLN